MIRKNLIKYAVAMLLALGLLIAGILLPGLIGAGLALAAGILAAVTLRAMIREDKQYVRKGHEEDDPYEH